MIYLIAIVGSLIFCAECVASECTAGNIVHLKNGRTPNAGAALFPMIPTFQIVTVGATWFLETYFPQFAVWILIGCFLAITVAWAFSFARLRAEYKKLAAACRKDERNP
jgi:hypothetical protein